MTNIISGLVKNDLVYRATPAWAKRIARRVIPSRAFNEAVWKKSNPYVDTPHEWEADFGSARKVGIVHDVCHSHANYMRACHEMEISYEVIRIDRSDWISAFDRSDCDVFMVWPTVYSTMWKQLFDERLRMLVEQMGRRIYPSLSELWLYESKKRVRDFLMWNDLPHPDTQVFYMKSEAVAFLDMARLPLVFKTDLGASSSGVEIVRTREHGRRLIDTCFGKGYVVGRADDRDRRWGYVIFQEYVDVVREWRIVRVGDYFFCRQKHKKGDFFSGSGTVSWAEPQGDVLDMVRSLTERFGFTSMAVDLFELSSGAWLICELQALFGGINKDNLDRGEKAMGRYMFDEQTRSWHFEHGYFYNNACSNLRIEYALKQLEEGAA